MSQVRFGVISILFSLVFAAVPALAGVSAIYDANNTLLGEYAESSTIIHSPQGYRFMVDGASGMVTQIQNDVAGFIFDTAALLYQTPNCTGQAFVGTSSGSPAGGLVFSSGTKGLYYVAKGAAQSVTAMGSVWSGSACTPITPGNFAAVPAQPNVPVTTGVPNTPFLPPLRLEVVPLSQFFRIFENGFESSYFPGRISEQRIT
jgi:hypothetical protein